MSNSLKREDLVARMIIALIDDVAALDLVANDLVRRCNWAVKVHINDVGKVYGKGGAHLDSLRVLLGMMGARYGEMWICNVDEPTPAARSDKSPIASNDDYNPSNEQNLLGEILDACLDEAPSIAVTRGPAKSAFAFTINAVAEPDYKRLVTALPTVHGPLTPVAALGTLFRAYGRQKGVHFTVNVPPK